MTGSVKSLLGTQLEAMQQELAEKAAHETVDCAVSSLLDDLLAAERQLSVGLSMQQAHQAGSRTAADLHTHLDWADGNTLCLQEVSACTSCHLHTSIHVYLDKRQLHDHILMCVKKQEQIAQLCIALWKSVSYNLWPQA